MPPPSPVVLTRTSPAPISSPEFYWIGTTSEKSCLWPGSTTDSSSTLRRPLEPFLEAVAFAQFRVWILDAHFDGPDGYAVLQNVLEMLLDDARTARRHVDVRILTGRYNELRQWLAAEGIADSGVMIRGRAGGFHDRYAVIDHDFWHFGSTVGGAHPDLSSASRGWNEYLPDFETLFINWWGS